MENLIETTQPKKNCKKCSAEDKLKKMPITMIVFSIYFLVSAIYGTVEFIKNIISLF